MHDLSATPPPRVVTHKAAPLVGPNRRRLRADPVRMFAQPAAPTLRFHFGINIPGSGAGPGHISPQTLCRLCATPA